MEKYSIDIQSEIDSILEGCNVWRNLFTIEIEHYIDGWAIFLRELRSKPRLIIIFKSYESNTYSIRSSEISFNTMIKNEEDLELFRVENLVDQKQLIKELRDIIYGKDLLHFAKIQFEDHFTK